jgi:hypothetical protein
MGYATLPAAPASKDTPATSAGISTSLDTASGRSVRARDDVMLLFEE